MLQVNFRLPNELTSSSEIDDEEDSSYDQSNDSEHESEDHVLSYISRKKGRSTTYSSCCEVIYCLGHGTSSTHGQFLKKYMKLEGFASRRYVKFLLCQIFVKASLPMMTWKPFFYDLALLIIRPSFLPLVLSINSFLLLYTCPPIHAPIQFCEQIFLYYCLPCYRVYNYLFFFKNLFSIPEIFKMYILQFPYQFSSISIVQHPY